MKTLQLKDLYDGFRDPKVIKGYQKLIANEAQKLPHPIRIMEVCGGHTHTIMKYGLTQLLPHNITFIHGPGCPVCIMPKERIDHAYTLAMEKEVILLTLGDMIKVPGSLGTLQDARAKGADVRYLYSPLDALNVAKENPTKKIIFFAIGFETTTPMTAALLAIVIKQKIKNIFFHINHVTVPEAMELLIGTEGHAIDAFIAPSHVSVISGAKIYAIFPKKYHIPIVVSGFEPVDMMESIYLMVKQFNEGHSDLEIQYKRLVSLEGNTKAQALIEHYFEKVDLFKWRGIGHIPHSALKLRDEFAPFDAEVIYKNILPYQEINDHKLCICGDILRGRAKPQDCTVFGKACNPTSPLGSCMVSSEGACAAYYKYGNLV